MEGSMRARGVESRTDRSANFKREADSDHQPWTFEILDWKIVLSLCFVESYRQEKGGYENGFDF